jgi:hypothetical protein
MRSRSSALRLMLLLLLSLVGTAPTRGVPRAPRPQAGCASAHCLFLPLVKMREIDYVRVGASGIGCNSRYCALGTYLSGYIVTSVEVPVYNVALNVRVYDFQGTHIYTATISPSLTATFPGEHNPFWMRCDACYSYDHNSPKTAIVEIASATLISTTVSVPLTVVSKRLTGNPYSYIVSGELRNDHAQTVSAIEVLALLGGAMYPSRLGAKTLAPGESTIYSSSSHADCPGAPTGCVPPGGMPWEGTVLAHGTVVP